MALTEKHMRIVEEVRQKLGRKQKKKPHLRKHKATSQKRRGVYVIKSGRCYRIGKSANVHRRIKSHFYNLSPLPEPKVICVIFTLEDTLLEKKLHEKFRDKRYANHEWFIDLNEADIRYLSRIKKIKENQRK